MQKEAIGRIRQTKLIFPFDKLIKAWRRHLGLTQKEVARRAGITQSALSQMERTTGNNRTATLEKLAKALGIETGQLVD